MADEPSEGRPDDPDGPRDRPDEPRAGLEEEQSAGPEPLGDLADRIRRRQSSEGGGRDGPPTPGVGGDRGSDRDAGPFVQQESFDASASDRLWGSLDEAGATASEGGDEHVVPKRSYCESCEHFGAPPAVRCEHPGTTIVEFVDADHVRVRNCPIVADRRASGESDREPGRQPGPFGRR